MLLHRELKLDGADVQTSLPWTSRPRWERSTRPQTVRSSWQDVTRITDTPALSKEERGDWLQVHLVRVGPAVLAADRPPLLREYADEVLLGEVTHHQSGPKLPLALTSEMRGSSRKDPRRPDAEDPVARVRGRQQLHQGQIAEPGVPSEFARRRLVRDDVVEGHHRSRDQVPVFGQAHWHHGLEIPVVIPLAVVQLEVVKLIRDRPKAAHRVSEFAVQFARVFGSRGFSDRAQAEVLT